MSFYIHFGQLVCDYIIGVEAVHTIIKHMPEMLIERNQSGTTGPRYVVRASVRKWLERAAAANLPSPLSEHAFKLQTDIHYSRWARYGYVNGDVGADQLDESGRVSGSRINAVYTAELLPRVLALRTQLAYLKKQVLPALIERLHVPCNKIKIIASPLC